MRDVLERNGAEVLERPRTVRADLREHRVRARQPADRRQRLHPRGDVHCVAVDLALGPEHDLAEVHADAEPHLLALRLRGVTLREPFLDRDGALDAADRERSYQDFYDIAEGFDRAVIAACRNPYLARTIGDLRSQTVRLRHLSHSGPRRMRTSLEEHRAMLKAIVQGDAQAAEAAGRHHLAQTLQALIDSLTGQDLAIGANVQLDVARR